MIMQSYPHRMGYFHLLSKGLAAAVAVSYA